VGEAAEVVHAATERLNAGDVDGFVELCSKRIRFQDVPEIPGSRLYQGPEEVRQWAENILEVSDDVEFKLWEKDENGDEAVMFDTSVEMTGASSGAQVGWRFWTVWRVKEGRITYHHGYSAKEEALADLESG
jgi:ketosteroid isomerase-like protein